MRERGSLFPAPHQHKLTILLSATERERKRERQRERERERGGGAIGKSEHFCLGIVQNEKNSQIQNFLTFYKSKKP
jgi:hypothetical protein